MELARAPVDRKDSQTNSILCLDCHQRIKKNAESPGDSKNQDCARLILERHDILQLHPPSHELQGQNSSSLRLELKSKFGTANRECHTERNLATVDKSRRKCNRSFAAG